MKRTHPSERRNASWYRREWVPELPYEPTMPTVLRRAAERFGDQDFVVTLDDRITFREAEVRSRRLAKQLVAAGVGKATRVGIQLSTGPDWVVAWIAVTRIGALAMPFSTLYRPAELRTAMRIGDVSLLITSSILVGKPHEDFLEQAVPGLVSSGSGPLRVPELPHLRSVWLLDECSRGWAHHPDLERDDAPDGIDDEMLAAIEDQVTPADLMTTVFTSGTTADPKAVVHTHGLVVRKTSLKANGSLNTIFPGRVLTLMPFFWIGGVQIVAGAIQSGATVLTLERLVPSDALQLAEREGATSVAGNPKALQSKFGATGLGSIESLRPQPVRPWDGMLSHRGQPSVGLGMTETFGPWASVEGVDCVVVDPVTGEEVPEGESGEFLVRGYTLMDSIYKCERHEVFTVDGYYRTGDLGYLHTGHGYFVERINEMIKTKGANVAPAEVEAVLNAYQGVRMSFVFPVDHPDFGQEVRAAVLPEGDTHVDVDGLLDHARRALSPYKVPARIETIEESEMTYLASSKPDKRAIVKALVDRTTERESGRDES